MGGRAGYLTGARACAADLLGRKIELSGRIMAILSILILLPLPGVAYVVGASNFSPDSWSYFELSRSVFSDRFYAFNTYRSYFSETYSTSFPLGYPVLLAVAGAVLGADPWASVAVNLVAAGVSWLLIIAVCRRLGIPSLHALGLCATLVLFPGYLDELYAGRAIPAAIAMVLLGVWASLYRAGFIAGLFIGLSALIRFDFLPNALLILAVGSLFWPSAPRLVAARLLGMLAAVSPWILYSWLHFGRLWVSDNGWVALSATPAFVLDFPAKPAIHAFADPLRWLGRVIRNGDDALWTIASNMWQVPFPVGLAIIVAVNLRRIDSVWKKRLAIIAIACAAGVLPYLLTGYVDVRYFSLIYLVFAFALAAAVAAMRGSEVRSLGNIVLPACLVAALLVAGSYNVRAVREALATRANEARIIAFISRLDACQRMNDKITYIFAGREGMGLVFRYGAMTGHRAAAIPSNFDRMSEDDKKRLFDTLAPYRLVEDLPDDIPCEST